MKTLPNLVGLALVAIAAAAAADEKSISREHTEMMTATIESIDPSTRTLGLKGESGERAEVVASPEVRNFDQMKVGDKVVLRYKIGVAAQIQPKGTKASAATAGEPVVHRAQPGAKPGGSATQTASATVTIESVDSSYNTVTFKRADGVVDTVAVNRPDGQEFIKKLKPGDAVQITYSEAIALNVEPASGGK